MEEGYVVRKVTFSIPRDILSSTVVSLILRTSPKQLSHMVLEQGGHPALKTHQALELFDKDSVSDPLMHDASRMILFMVIRRDPEWQQSSCCRNVTSR